MANPFTIASTATRHLLDANVSFGQASERYNARDDYRRRYSDDQRLGAGVGAGLAVALPVSAGLAWWQRGLKIPGLSAHSDAVATGFAMAKPRGMSPAVMQNVGRAVGVTALAGATYVGVRKSMEIAQDDGHLGAAGTATGVLGGAVLGNAIGRRFGGKIAAVSTTVGAIAGGVAGSLGGRQVDGKTAFGKRIGLGEPQIDKEFKQAPQVDHGAADRIRSFGRGAFNHFTEVGPATQGLSLGGRWGMRETVQKQYSNAERSGSMHGDLLAAGIMGGGALAVAKGLGGMSRAHVANGVTNLRAGADLGLAVLGRGPTIAPLSHLGSKGQFGIGAAALGIAGLTTWKAMQTDRETFGNGAATGIAAATLAATAGTAAIISRHGAFTTMTPGARAANSALAAAALIGVLSTARLPLQQFMNDARDAHAANGPVDKPVAALATGVGAIGGGLGAYRGLNKLVPDNLHFRIPVINVPVNKQGVVLAGTAIAAAATGGMGFGLSATMPDIKTVGMSVAGGAAAGAAVGGFARGIGMVPGIVGGAALGLSASALLRDEEPAAPAPTTPQDAAGTATG